ncbi:hypothetical protein HDE_10450 [Halotydeus destructor]|nr:hypothetical protein HDE_10450 [Halotydeus destructor]
MATPYKSTVTSYPFSRSLMDDTMETTVRESNLPEPKEPAKFVLDGLGPEPSKAAINLVKHKRRIGGVVPNTQNRIFGRENMPPEQQLPVTQVEAKQAPVPDVIDTAKIIRPTSRNPMFDQGQDMSRPSKMATTQNRRNDSHFRLGQSPMGQ